MKNKIASRIAIAAFAACGLFLSAPANTASQSSSESELRPILLQLDAAANSHDTGKFMAFFAHDPHLIFAFNGTEITGFDELTAQQRKWWNDGKSDVVYTRRGDAQFTALSGGGEVVTLVEQSSRTLPDGSNKNNLAVISLVWQKLPEGWRIVYGHESTEH
jgi:ketosteroid isomerase-like protein